MSTQALRERIAALKKEANHLLAEKGSQVWSKEDQGKFDNLMDEADRADRQLQAHQRALDRDAEENFKDVERTEGGAKKNEYQKGLDIFLRKSERQMSQEEALLVRNTMSTTTGSEGGFTVRTEVADSFVDLLKAYGFVRNVASQITTENGADMSYPTSDGTSEVGERVAQNASAAAQDPTFGTRALNTYKYSSKVIAVPIELLQDARFDVQGMVMKRARNRVGRIQNQDWSFGTGSSQPVGITVAASVGKTGTTGQTTTIIYDDLIDMLDSLDVAYLEENHTDMAKGGSIPTWMFSQTLRRTIRKIKDTAGRPIWTPSYDAGLQAGTPDMLLGCPVQINNDMPAPAANAKSLAFGKFDNYVIRDAMEIQLFRFDDSAYITRGQIGFLAWARAGGNLMDLNAVKTYAHSAT